MYVETPMGKASWHFHDSQEGLFRGPPQYDGEWDVHTTEQKYRRLHATYYYDPLPEVARLTSELAAARQENGRQAELARLGRSVWEKTLNDLRPKLAAAESRVTDLTEDRQAQQ